MSTWLNGPKFRANGTIAPAVFVKIDVTADNMVVQATAGSKISGVSQEGMRRTPGLPGSDNTIAAVAGDEIDVFAPGEVCMLTAGAAVVRGDYLKSDANGLAVPTTTGGTAFYGAEALESASGINVKFQARVLLGYLP
jgi:hypothetical protein